MAQQTAVEQLINYMKENFHLTDESLKKFEEAKEMEKQQIEKAHGEDRSYLQNDGSWKTINGEQYYTQNYNKSE